MCTAVSCNAQDHYFGRNLDLEYGYDERITVTPRNFPFHFRKRPTIGNHYAMIGMAAILQSYPLYYEATNEMGLSMAGLNFPGIATYLPEQENMDNITPFEFIPWILGQCKDLQEAKAKLQNLNLVNIPFSERIPLSPLHWIIADRDSAITVEPMPDGIHIYENPVGVLTNNPPFDFHLYNLQTYINVTTDPAQNRFSEAYSLSPYSNGMGGIGLPGDFSSASRFVKASFVKLNSVFPKTEEGCVSQFFHILSSVAMPKGSVRLRPEEYEITRYSCCCNTDKGIYYYTTYDNSTICAVDMLREDLNGDTLVSYEMIQSPQILVQNR